MDLLNQIRQWLSGEEPAPSGEEDEFSFSRESGPNYDKDPFLYSLDRLTPEDIPLSHERQKPSLRQRLGAWGSNVLLIVCIAVFAVSCVLLADNLIQKRKGNALYDEVAAEFDSIGRELGLEDATKSADAEGILHTLRASRADTALLSITGRQSGSGSAAQPSAQTAPSSDNAEQLEKLRALLRSYKERNDDVYGYISVPSVGISYVLVQGEDNDYYLDHNYKKEYLVIGSIFVDYRCNETMMLNFNTVLYGHNIVTGAMFHGVERFFEEDIFNNALIYIYTMDGIFVYKAFSVYATMPSSGYIRTGFTSWDDFVTFAQAMKARSSVPSDVEIGEGDRMLTLSTCTNFGDGRYALHAVLIEAYT